MSRTPNPHDPLQNTQREPARREVDEPQLTSQALVQHQPSTNAEIVQYGFLATRPQIAGEFQPSLPNPKRNDRSGVCILTLDGGGIRGLSSLYILKGLMQELNSPPGGPYFPHEHFDLIAGTSTGGLIAIMLGILKMDINKCIEEYVRLCPVIFPIKKKRAKRSTLGHICDIILSKPFKFQYDPQPLEIEVKKLVDEKLGTGVDTLMRSENKDERCKVFVCANAVEPRELRLFGNYEVKGDIHDDCFIWQACRATSAAPFLFPPVEIGRHSTQYVDGAFAGNNPTKLAKTQAFEIWGSGVRVDALVSIGTGVRPLVDVGNKHKGIIKTLADIATETEETAGQIKDELEQQGLAHTYFRFNVDRGLESVGLDEWNQNSRVMTVTAKYVQSHKEDFKRCVKQIHDPAFPHKEKWPEHLYRVPSTPVSNFVKQEEAWNRLEAFCSSVMGPGPQRFILWGMPGLGKSTLCNEFIRCRAERYWAVVRIDASTKTSAEEDLQKFYAGLPKNEYINSKHALSNDTRPWLLLLDNVTEKYHVYAEFLPLTLKSNCTILITTRVEHFENDGEDSFCLKQLHHRDAIDLLLKIKAPRSEPLPTENSEKDRNTSGRIVENLGCLPLAIRMAGSVMKCRKMTLDEFVSQTDSRLQSLLEDPPERSDSTSTSNNSIFTIFELCFEGTQDLETTPGDAEIALEMLRFFSFLHGDEITENVMLSAAQYFQTETRKRNPAQNPHFTFLALDLDKLKDASRRCRALLANFSLLQGQSLTRLGTEGMHYSMHVMIKHCVKIHLNRANEEEKYWRKALFTIADALSFKPSHRAYSAVLQRTSIAHIDECIGDRKLNGYAEDSELDNAWLLFGRVYCENRRVDAAARLRTEVVDHAGYEHDNKRRAENDLAISLRDQGKYKKALETRRRLLMESEERCKGATTLHLHKKLRDQVCSAKLNLADSLGDYDEYFEAVTFQEEAWAERKELLGKEDPKTLKAHRRLANSYNRIGDSVKALSLRQSIVDILGDQGSTKYEQEALYAYSDLADSLDDMGDLQGAWALRDRVYRRREEIDGSQKSLHYVALDLLTARFNCATSRGRLKILEDDVILEERIALREEYRERFGAESRDALKALTALGNCYRRMNKKDQALKVLSEALELTQRIWPPNCSAILNRLSDVISIKIAMLPKGQVSEELIAERKEIVKRWEQRGSQWTRQIWEARNRLADLYSLFGQHTEALEERSQIEKEQERKLEADDPGLLRTRFRMAKDLSRESQKLQGTVRNRKELDAMDLYRRVCQDSTKSHRLKMAAMRALIDNLMPKNPEEYSEYTKYLHDLLPLQIKFLGKEHPDTDRTQRQYDLLQPNPDDPPTDTESYNSADDTHEDQSKNARTTGNPPSPKGTSTTDFSNHKMQDMKTSEVYP